MASVSSRNFVQQIPAKGVTALEVLGNIDLTGRHMLITGANAGIGFETTKALAVRNAHVIMACKNVVAASQAKDIILDEKEDANISIIHVDLSDLESVKGCAEQYLRSKWPLHCLILNAGVYNPPHRVTDAGFEATFQINHLAPFYLTQLLRPRLIESSPSRVVVLSSEAHKHPLARLTPSQIRWEKLSPTHKITLNSPIVAYSISKMCNILFAQELDNLFQFNGVRAFSCHPGLVRRSLARNTTYIRMCMRLAKSADKGAASTVFCACGQPDILKGGAYYDTNCRVKSNTVTCGQNDSSKLLWKLSQEMIDHYQQRSSTGET